MNSQGLINDSIQRDFTMHTFRGCVCVFLFLLIAGSSFAQPTLTEQFRIPPTEAKPWTFWYWMRGAVSKEGIKADLEAMKEVGLGGAYLMPIKGIENNEYPNAVSQLTPEWWEMVRYSMEQADRLGLKLGLHISDGFALAGGPWIKPAESMQKVVFTDTIVKGGKINKLPIAQPETVEDYYQDIAVYALPVYEASYNSAFSVTSDNPDDPTPFFDPEKAFRSVDPCNVDYRYSKPFTLRSIEVTPSGNNIQSQRLAVYASNDGVNFRLIKQFVPPRQGWQNYGINTTFSLTPTRAKYFRLSWTPEGSEPGSEDLDAAKWKPTLKIKAIKLSSESRINSWEGKAGLVWRIGTETSQHEIPDSECTPLNKIIQLTPLLKDGKLSCKLPKGNWRILRIGHTSTGLTNATGGGGKGLECDKFSTTAVQKQFDNWFGAAFSKTDPVLAHRVLKFMHIDSWECGSQNWSENFAQEFKTRRGYDLMPFLPLMAGFPIESSVKSEMVLRDIRTTIAELVDDVFFKTMLKNANAMGCETSAECVAPTMVSDGLLHFKEVVRPMGEFWLRSPTHDKPNDMLDAISGAHIYGKKIIQSESFTQLRTNWDEHPAMLKPLLDRNFALGINKVFFHIFVHNPYTGRAPGTTLDGIGLYFQRDQIWWKQGKSFVDYMARCQALLQYGHPVTDIAVFTGEEIPRRAFTPDRLVPLLPGIFGEERVKSEKARLANAGQPQLEMPAKVFHSANTFTLDNWMNPLNGYHYDSFNKDALLRLARVENGNLVLADGSSYKAVLFPTQQSMNAKRNGFSDEVSSKIEELKKAGVYMPELPYLSDKFSFEPDVIVPENIVWTHRQDKNTDIYFVSNQENNSRNVLLSFRVSGREPQFWNPVNGDICSIKHWEVKNRRTEVKLMLEANQSFFIVFDGQSEMLKGENSANTTSVVLNNEWEVSFVNNKQLVTTNVLFDWSKNHNPLVKYYSGTAIYKTSFDFSKGSKSVFLKLGQVCNLATVRVNGMDCGTAWTDPYEVDITNALINGTNKLEIDVTNTWANAINGYDKGTPPFDGIWTNGKYRMSEDKLLEAGLIGPVEILSK